jgi:tetratricopeptide (TPR) repeat protein
MKSHLARKLLLGGLLALGLALVAPPLVARSRASAAFERIRAAARVGHVGEAEAALEALRGIRRDDPRLAAAEGELALAHGRAAPARERFEEAVRATPELASAWAQVGYLRALAGDHAGARAALERAVELDPRLWQARHHLGELAALEHDTPAARAHLEAAVALRPPAERRWARAESDALLARLGARP